MFNINEPYNDLPLISTLEIKNLDKLNKLAEDTRVSIEILNYAVSTMTNPNILLDTLVFQEAKTSSNIENIVTTNDDLYKGVLLNDYTEEAKEVADYKDGLFIGFQQLKSKNQLSLGDLELINEKVNKNQHGIRTNLIGFNDLTKIVNKKDNGEQNVLYIPPHGKDIILSLLIDMLDFVYQDDDYMYSPLIKIALAHYQFESIHPFRDGNGRTGRILNILFLCQKKYLDFPILYASSYIIKHKNEYYNLINKTHETEDYTEFITFMLNCFNETAKHTLHIVEQIKSAIEHYTNDEFIGELKGQSKVLKNSINLVFEKAYVKISDIVELGIHRETAANYLNQLEDKGLLSKQKVGKENIYKNEEIFRIFNEEYNE